MTTVSINHTLSKHHLQLVQVPVYIRPHCVFVIFSVLVVVCSVVAWLSRVACAVASNVEAWTGAVYHCWQFLLLYSIGTLCASSKTTPSISAHNSSTVFFPAVNCYFHHSALTHLPLCWCGCVIDPIHTSWLSQIWHGIYKPNGVIGLCLAAGV